MIPARSGSKGIRNKNIADLYGFPLMSYAIAVAKLCNQIDRIIVSTNSEEYSKIAFKYGAEVPFLRPEEISGDTSTDLEYIKFTLLELLKRENIIPEYIVLLRPTTPIRNPDVVGKAVEMLKTNHNASSVVSVSNAKYCPYKWMKIGEDGYLSSLFSEMKPDDVNLPRQSFPEVYIPDGYVDVIRCDDVLKYDCIYGKKAYPFIINDKVVDIDSMEDIESIDFELLKNNLIYQYLNVNF